MPNSRKFVVDGAIGFALLIALGVVFAADRGKPKVQPPPVVVTPQPVSQPAPAAPPLRLAVTPHQYDDMGKLLGQLGRGFAYTEIPLTTLEDASKLAEYDVVFFTCGTDDEHWLTKTNLGDGDRPGVHKASWNNEMLDRIREASAVTLVVAGRFTHRTGDLI